jgi:hypothetical protein
VRDRELTGEECRELLSQFSPSALCLSAGHFHILAGQYEEILARTLSLGFDGVEFCVSEQELPGFAHFARSQEELLSQLAVSLHLPLPQDAQAVASLCEKMDVVDRFVLHPERPAEHHHFAVLGKRLLIENMDANRSDWRSAAELEPLFGELPEACICLDLAHIEHLDPTLSLAYELTETLGERIGQVHLSVLASDCWHLPLTRKAVEKFAPLLEKLRHVPWVLEAPFADGPCCDPRVCAKCRYGRESLFPLAA